MRKSLTTHFFIWCLTLGFALTTVAQDISTNQNQVTESFGQESYPDGGGVTITHSANPDTVIAGMSVACTSGGITSDNQYWRSFILADFGIVDDFSVTMVEVGIENATAGSGGEQPMTVNLYTADTPWPTLSLTLIGTATVMVPDQAVTLFQIPVTGTAPAGSELVVEINIADATGGAGHTFFLGANNIGQTSESWLSSTGCGIPGPPAGLPLTTTAIGFPDAQWVMSVTGDVAAGGCALFFDDFEAGLGAWTITNDGGDCVWTDIPIASRPYTLPPSATGFGLAADSDSCGPGTTVLTTAQAGPFDASGLGIVNLSFDHDWRVIQGSDEAHVELSTDGATWMSVISWVGVSQRDTSESLDISSMAGGQSAFWIRFRVIQPGWDWWWVIDNVCIDGIIPVELTSFAASVSDENVTLNWSTATETNNQGFEVERNSGNGFEKIGFVAGFGTSSEVHNYSYVDASLEVGTYTYRLKQIDFNGSFEYSDVIEVDVTIPKVFALEQNYPNPFNPSTIIKFSLAADSKVTLTVFDVLGQEVANLIRGNLAAGSHEINFNASHFNSGVYFYRIDATAVDGTNFTAVKKMILTK